MFVLLLQVTSQSAFANAVIELRSPEGHNPDSVISWKNPVQWANIDSVLATSSSGTGAIEGNANFTIATLIQHGITPFAVVQLGCSVLTFSTMNSSQPAYWAERWELFKQRYAQSRWLWLRGVREIEFWNEPDLPSNTCMDLSTTWLEMYTLSSTAIQNAFEDMNNDKVNKLISCPPHATCPLTPYIIASAFAKTAFSGDANFGETTVTNEHLLFPPYLNRVNSSWYNLQAYSYHSYDKTGATQGTDTATVQNDVASVHDSTHAAPLPVHVTEHAAHTAANFAPLNLTTDDVLPASRLASQILIQAKYGIESILFKTTMTPIDGSSDGSVKKNGIMFADNTNFPFRVGDTTASAEAARIVISRVQGSKAMLDCSIQIETLGSSQYRNCLTIISDRTYDIVLVNDASDSKSVSAVDKPMAFDVSMNMSSLGLHAGSAVIITEFSRETTSSAALRTYHGEVSAITSLDETLTVFHHVPVGAVIAFSVTKAPQVSLTLAPVDDTHVAGGRWISSTAFSTSPVLKVGTSITSDHSTTHVAALQFSVPSDYKSANFVLLELVVSETCSFNESISSVVGLSRSESWMPGSLNWQAASYALRIPVNESYLNKVSYDFIDFDTVDMLGHVTVSPTDVGVVKRIDLTEFVKAAAYPTIEIFIARRVRNNEFKLSSTSNEPFPADGLNEGQSVSFYSSRVQDTTLHPQLRFFFDSAFMEDT